MHHKTPYAKAKCVGVFVLKKNYKATVKMDADVSAFQKGFQSLEGAINGASDCLQKYDKTIDKFSRENKQRAKFLDLKKQFDQNRTSLDGINKRIKEFQQNTKAADRYTADYARTMKHLNRQKKELEKTDNRLHSSMKRTVRGLGAQSSAVTKLMAKEGQLENFMERRARRISRLERRRRHSAAFSAAGSQLPLMAALTGNPNVAMGGAIGNIYGGARGALIGGGIGALAMGGMALGGAVVGQYQQRIGQVRTNNLSYRQMQNTGGFSDRQREQMKKNIRGISSRTGTTETELIDALQILVAEGVDYDKASGMLETIAKTKVGSGASVDSLGKLAASLQNNFGIGPEGFTAAMDKLSMGGKLGSFELRDMADAFPQLGAKLKQRGMGNMESIGSISALLQIVKKGAKDPTQAANNMNNLLAKMDTEDTQKRFAKKGINVLDLLENPQKYFPKAKNQMEAFVMQVSKLTDGGTNTAVLNQLFGDQQVKDAMIPLLQNWDDYEKYREEIAWRANGTIEKDYENTVTEMSKSQSNLDTAWTNSTEAWSKALEPLGVKYNNLLAQMLNDSIAFAPHIAKALEHIWNNFVDPKTPRELEEEGYKRERAYKNTREGDMSKTPTLSSLGVGSPLPLPIKLPSGTPTPITRATGGDTGAGAVIRVGENGPETLYAGSNAHVKANTHHTNTGGGGAAVINVYVQSLPTSAQLDSFMRLLDHRGQRKMYDLPSY